MHRAENIQDAEYAPPLRRENTPEYSTWRNMRHRCNGKGATGYENYGGRGIKVCDRWKSFDLFLADMGPKPSPEHWLERLDTDGDYEPDNCVWALVVVNQNNRRNNRLIRWNGEVKTVSEWARIVGISPQILFARMRSHSFVQSVRMGATDTRRSRK